MGFKNNDELINQSKSLHDSVDNALSRPMNPAEKKKFAEEYTQKMNKFLSDMEEEDKETERFIKEQKDEMQKTVDWMKEDKEKDK